jgi:O-antigen/teichoic acid export membrane protein
VALRGLTLASKFLLIFFLARFLEPAELGLYGLVVATIGYALFLLGLDFYTFSTRDILKRERCEWGGLLKSQGALTFWLYLLFMPLLSVLFVMDVLPWHLAGWFMALLVLEHLNQELMRLLVAASEPLLAGAALFLRSGGWAVILVALMAVDGDMRSLNTVLLAWTVGSVVALVMVVMRLATLQIGGWRSPVDWGWVRLGIKVALPLLLATLALRAMYILDRYWIEALVGLEVLGAYVLFVGIANAMVSFLDAGVFAFSYPRMITAYQQQRPAAYRQEQRALLLQTCIVAVGFSLVALLLIHPLLGWLGKAVYIEQQAIFPWILLATLLYCLSMVPHYALYAQSRDRSIIHSHIAGLVAFVPSTWFFSLHWPDIAIPLGLCLAFFLILLWKSLAYFRLTPAPYRLRLRS